MNSLFNINVCRVCMQNDKRNDLTSDNGLLEKFEFTTRLQISKEDNMPKTICSKCTARLKVAYHFIKTAHDSEKNLKQFLEKINLDFKEVTEGSKSSKNFINEHIFTEDDILSLMDEENHEEITTYGNVNDNNLKKFKADIEVRNLNGNHVQNLKGEKLDNCKNENGYTFSKDVLLIDASNEIDGTYKDNAHLMEISVQDEGNKTYNEEVDDHALENNQSYTSINILESNDESEIRCQSTELTIEESEENIEYDMIINSQDDTIQCQSVYIDESSVEGSIQKDADDDFDANSLKKEIEESNEKVEIIGQSELARENFSSRESIVHRFYCIKCNRDFSTKTNLNRHMQSHEGNKPFSCPECKKSFTQKSTLKQHMYIHTGERPYVCEVCNRGFTQCKSLIFHMRRHTGEKPFHCEYCLITFRQKDALRIHILKHHVVIERTINGTEIFSCIICQKKFQTKVEFKTHMKIHTASGEVDNAVDLFEGKEERHLTKLTRNLSDATSTDSEFFNAAVVNVRASSAAEPSRVKKFQCRKCFKCFALKKSLVRHMRIHYAKSDDLSECIDCDLRFSTVETYQEHISLCHQYTCSACPLLVFKTIQELKIHMIEHELNQ